MKDLNIRRLATAGVLAAAVFLMTAFFRIPIGAGYLNFGDVGVFFAAMTLPWGYAALCAGIGSALADLYGYPAYTPVTLLVKAAAALTFALLWRRLPGRLRYLAFLSVLLIPAGYFVFERFAAGAFAWADLPWNLLQSVVGAALAFLIERLTEGRLTL
ncbi:MAG: ECF transporter S component [Clostridia bacterium]|jgi:uncharacterized membrane protein|nr:ECF transporter S component [Clostridia bacterium]